MFDCFNMGTVARLKPKNQARLGEVIRRWRFAEERGLRQVAGEMGIMPSTLCRVEAGKACDSDSFFNILNWLMGREKPKKGTAHA